MERVMDEIGEGDMLTFISPAGERRFVLRRRVSSEGVVGYAAEALNDEGKVLGFVNMLITPAEFVGE